MSSLKLGLQLGYWQAEPPTNFVEIAQEADLEARAEVGRGLGWSVALTTRHAGQRFYRVVKQ